MSSNKIKLNTDKTKLLVLNAKHRLGHPLHLFQYEMMSSRLQYVQGIWEKCLIPIFQWSTHINTTCKASLFHLRNLSRIRKYLSTKSNEILVHALITSKIDFCHAILYGALQNLIKNCRVSKIVRQDKSV